MQELEFAVDLAHSAGAIAMRYFRADPAQETKSDGSIVTIADREAEQLIRETLARAYPADAVLGEEFGERAGTSGRRWIIDPIDGTFSFAHGVPLFGVLIALETGRAPQLGVAHFPALTETVAAARGYGCTWNGVRAKTSTTTRLSDALLVCGDFFACSSHGLGSPAAALQRRVRERRGWGDCYGHVLVATGRADVALDPVVSVWDCAALAAILEEAGGTFTDWSGRATIYGANAISTNSALFAEVMAVTSAGA